MRNRSDHAVRNAITRYSMSIGRLVPETAPQDRFLPRQERNGLTEIVTSPLWSRLHKPIHGCGPTTEGEKRLSNGAVELQGLLKIGARVMGDKPMIWQRPKPTG